MKTFNEFKTETPQRNAQNGGDKSANVTPAASRHVGVRRSSLCDLYQAIVVAKNNIWPHSKCSDYVLERVICKVYFRYGDWEEGDIWDGFQGCKARN